MAEAEAAAAAGGDKGEMARTREGQPSLPSITLQALAGQVDTAKRLLMWPYCHSLDSLGLPPLEAGPCLSLLLAADACSVGTLVTSLQPPLLAAMSPRSAPAILAAAQQIGGCERLAFASAHYILRNFPEVVAAVSDLVPALDILEQCLQLLIATTTAKSSYRRL